MSCSSCLFSEKEVGTSIKILNGWLGWWIIKFFANTADFLKCPPLEEGFRLHDPAVIDHIRFNLEKVIKMSERRRGDKSISAVTVPEAAPPRDYVHIGLLLKRFRNFR